MTKEKMHKLAYLKWEWIVDNWNYSKSYNKNIIILRLIIQKELFKSEKVFQLLYECAYCHIYVENECNGCPLQKINQQCVLHGLRDKIKNDIDRDSYYYKWKWAINENNEAEATFWADMLRDTIRCLVELDGVKV